MRRIMTVTLLALVVAAVMSCRSGNGGEKTVPTRDVKTVMDAHVEELMNIPGVTGVAIGELEDGTPCIQVLVVEKSDEIAKKIPDTIEGHPVVIIESGVIRPMSDDESGG